MVSSDLARPRGDTEKKKYLAPGAGDSRPQGRWAHGLWPALILILTLAVAVRVLSYRCPDITNVNEAIAATDFGKYVRLARTMTSGDFEAGTSSRYAVFPLRVGLFAPIALAFRLGGPHEATMIAYPLLLSLLGILVAYFAAKSLFGARAGLIAACLAAFLPIDVEYASWVLPDVPAAFWMNVGVLLAYAGSRQDRTSGKVGLGALAGLALFASWLCKETVLYLMPFVGLYVLWLVAKDQRNVVLLIAGAVVLIVLVGLEGSVYHRYAGDYLLRYHAVYKNYEACRWPVEQKPIPNVTLTGIAVYLAHRTMRVSRTMLLNANYAFTLAAALVACACAIFRRQRRYVFPGLWFCWLLLVFGFGSASLKAYQPLSMSQERFLYPILLPAILLVAGLADSLLAPRAPNVSAHLHRGRLFWGGFLSACLAGVSLFVTARHVRAGLAWRGRAEKELSRILKPTDPLYADFRTAMTLKSFWIFPKTDSTHYLDREASLAQIPPNVYVLINRSRWEDLFNSHNRIPASWQKLRVIDSTTLYRVPPAPVTE